MFAVSEFRIIYSNDMCASVSSVKSILDDISQLLAGLSPFSSDDVTCAALLSILQWKLPSVTTGVNTPKLSSNVSLMYMLSFTFVGGVYGASGTKSHAHSVNSTMILKIDL